MIIILKNIPEHTVRHEIEGFVKPAIRGGFLRKNGRIGKISIHVQNDTVANTFKYHSLVTVEPDSVALKAIKKLYGKPIHGRHIVVHEYHIRSWHNDPRIHREPIQELVNQRKNDRRQHKLEVKKERVVLFTSNINFYHKLD